MRAGGANEQRTQRNDFLPSGTSYRMAHMNHKEAVELQLAVKYVLGELPPVQRDEYEDHYIDCPGCAKDVHAAAAFADTAREVFRQEARGEELARSGQNRARGWFAWPSWLRPAFAALALLVLLGVVGFQNLATIPRLKSRAHVFNSFSLVAANLRHERDEEAERVQVHKNEMFALDFDFLPSQKFDRYLCQLRDQQGQVVLQASIPADKTGQEVHLLLPNGLERPGKYNLVLAGDPGAKGEWVNANEVSRLIFMVEFRP
jgi:hypothetical protein